MYEQWLGTNLTDLNTPCLPRDLANNEKVAFNGHFALQVSMHKLTSTPLSKTSFTETAENQMYYGTKLSKQMGKTAVLFHNTLDFLQKFSSFRLNYFAGFLKIEFPYCFR